MIVRETLAAAEAAAVFDALSQVTRLEAFRLLLRYHPFGLAAGDIARLLAVPHNTLSTHLAVLQAAGLVRSRREGRTVITVCDPVRYAAAEAFLSEGQPNRRQRKPIATPISYPIKRPGDDVTDRRHNVLILCTGNSARSLLAEAIVNREGQGRFCAYSAGSQPKGRPNPLALDLLTSLGYDVGGLRSKSWSEFATKDAPRMDIIITVCDGAAGEACPHWPGHPLVAHWGIPDPADVAGTPEQKRAAFQDAYRQLMHRVTALINLPIDRLSLTELRSKIAEIGRMEGATELTLAGHAA
jgi:arsenate reductase